MKSSSSLSKDFIAKQINLYAQTYTHRENGECGRRALRLRFKCDYWHHTSPTIVKRVRNYKDFETFLWRSRDVVKQSSKVISSLIYRFFFRLPVASILSKTSSTEMEMLMKSSKLWMCACARASHAQSWVQTEISRQQQQQRRRQNFLRCFFLHLLSFARICFFCFWSQVRI